MRDDLPGAPMAMKLAQVQDGPVLCACCHQAPRIVGGGRLYAAVWCGRPSLQAPAVLVCKSCLLTGLVILDPAEHF